MTELPKRDNTNIVALKPKQAGAPLFSNMPAPLPILRDKTRTFLQQLTTDLFNAADDALFEMAEKAMSNHDQNMYFDSMRELRLKRRQIELDFFARLDDAFLSILTASEKDRREDAYVIEELSVVQNDELEAIVASDAMTHRGNDLYSALLEPLAARIDHLVPEKVFQKTNPVGVDVLCLSFMNATKIIQLDVKARLVVYKLFDLHVLKRLRPLYEELNATLIKENILPHYSPSAPVTKRAPAARKTVARNEDGDGQVLESLRELLSRARGEFSQVAASDNELGSDEVFDLLSHAQSHFQANMGTATLTPSAINDYIQSQSQTHNKVVNRVDHDVINLVAMMFEFILDDRNLAESMKALLARLQIPYIKVALVDVTFFSQGGHPARKLLNEMASACIGWQEPPADKLARDILYVKLNSLVKSIVTEFERDLALFDHLLVDLRVFVEKEQRRAKVLEQRLIDAEDGKARTERARRFIDDVIGKLATQVGASTSDLAVVRDLWSNILFLHVVKSGTHSPEWKASLNSVVRLLRALCIRPASEEKKAQLLKEVPVVIRDIKRALSDAAFDDFKWVEQVKSLESIFISRLKRPLGIQEFTLEIPVAVNAKEVESPEVAVIEPIDVASSNIENLPVKVSDENEEVVEAEDKEAIETLEETPEIDVPQTVSVPDDTPESLSAGESDILVTEQHMALVSNFSMGTWFETTGDSGEVFRCRLAAIIKSIGKYIFVNRAGVKVAEETKSSLARAVASGKYKVLDDGMLFDRALESVITNLRDQRRQ